MKDKKEGLSNYLPVNRRFFDHAFWKEDRIYSKAEAWMDLMRSARFEVSEGKTLIGMKVVTWHRGEIVASVRFLAARWQWGNGKVLRFLEMLEEEGMITRRHKLGQTIVTLCNYELHNGKPTTERKTEQQRNTSNAIQQSNTKEQRNAERNSNEHTCGTPPEHHRNETNIDNIVNKEEDSISDESLAQKKANEEGFKKFIDWIGKYASNVNKMEEPFTLEQYQRLKERNLSPKDVQRMVMKMHNWKPLLKKNKSAYLTFLNWIELEEKREAK